MMTVHQAGSFVIVIFGIVSEVLEDNDDRLGFGCEKVLEGIPQWVSPNVMHFERQVGCIN